MPCCTRFGCCFSACSFASMLVCHHFFPFLSGFTSEHAQPFRVEVDPLVHVLLDVHSHMMHTEIIGLLGGVWNEKKTLLRILSAHPCRTLGTGNGQSGTGDELNTVLLLLFFCFAVSRSESHADMFVFAVLTVFLRLFVRPLRSPQRRARSRVADREVRGNRGSVAADRGLVPLTPDLPQRPFGD